MIRLCALLYRTLVDQLCWVDEDLSLDEVVASLDCFFVVDGILRFP